eukprot:185013-Chlamydomonas_euryale.AAC.1
MVSIWVLTITDAGCLMLLTWSYVYGGQPVMKGEDVVDGPACEPWHAHGDGNFESSPLQSSMLSAGSQTAVDAPGSVRVWLITFRCTWVL